MPEQEMTLDEWVEKLTPTHRARKELTRLRAELKAEKEAHAVTADVYFDLDDDCDRICTALRNYFKKEGDRAEWLRERLRLLDIDPETFGRMTPPEERDDA